jgi:hypothetical protein
MREGCHFVRLLDIGSVEDEILIRIPYMVSEVG